jgi:acetamidase/formamidase
MVTHSLEPTPDTVHWGYFDAALEPVLEIDSGDTVVAATVSGAPEYMPGPPYEVPPALAQIHRDLEPQLGPHILTGPIAVRGARPGHTLEVEILDISLDTDWGWNVHKAGLGTLPTEDFAEGWIRHIPIDRDEMSATMPWGTELPLAPFFGILAVAPSPEAGRVSSKPPNLHGGNMDNKELVVGSRVYLPVFAEGARFSIGDGHAVQGDGEVSLTALETCLTGTIRLTVHDSEPICAPRAITPDHYITHGFDPDLDRAAEDALRDMIRWLVELLGIRPDEAYMFASLAVDLHVTQLVDGNKGVHAMLRRSLVE